MLNADPSNPAPCKMEAPRFSLKMGVHGPYISTVEIMSFLAVMR